MQELRLFKVGKISIHLSCGSHIGAQNNAPPPPQLIFPYNVIANLQLLWPITPNNLKFGTKTRYMVL